MLTDMFAMLKASNSDYRPRKKW